jgi:hypothetical protein
MLKKFLFKAGLNRENTRYTTEGGWYSCDKVRFRQGTPEKIGGWVRISVSSFLGICRSLWAWVTLGGQNLIGVGTNLKFYLEQGGAYRDITPIRNSYTLTNPFATTLDSSTVTVTDANGGYTSGDFVTFYGGTAVDGLLIRGEYELTIASTTTYTINIAVPVTITQASPAVFTSQNQLSNGVAVTLSTTGTLPSPLTPNTTYYVVNTSGYTFQLSSTAPPIDTIINTPGSIQSGTHTVTAKATGTTAAGGGTVQAVYQINVGPAYALPITGWGSGTWSSGTWGIGQFSTDPLRLWSQSNFGEDLIFGPRGGKIYYWDATIGITSPAFTVTIATPGVVSTSVNLANGTPIRLVTEGALPTGLTVGTLYYVVNSSGTTFNLATSAGGSAINTSGSQSGTHRILANASLLSSYGGSSNVPSIQNFLLVSDINRFVFAFGCNDVASATLDPMLIRWSDQEDATNWTPDATNQAGSLRLSRGSEILTANQARQEVLVWTDAALYSLQYLGAPAVWGAQLMGDNISIVSQSAVAYANGVSYWMGKDKFYLYNGNVATLRCDLRQFIFSDINTQQFSQIFAGTNEGFNEAWWFYCSANSITIDRYVIYNYLEDVWYYGTMERTAWLDSGIFEFPRAATYSHNLVDHEVGVDNQETATTLPIVASITSAEFDVEDGDKFMFIRRVLPDLTFRTSTASSPSGTMTLYPLKNSGSGYASPASVGGSNNATVARSATVPIEAFTGQVYVRLRARQMSMKWESTDLGVAWQLGSFRLDMKPDGKASGSGVSGG